MNVVLGSSVHANKSNVPGRAERKGHGDLDAWTTSCCRAALRLKCQPLSCVWLFATPWTVALQSLSMGFSRQEHWSELPCPSPGDLPNPGIEPESPAVRGGLSITWATREAHAALQGPPSSPGAPCLSPGRHTPASFLWDQWYLGSAAQSELIHIGRTGFPGVCVHDGVLWDEQRCIYSVTLGSRDITVSWRKGELGWGWGAAQGAWRCYPPHVPSRGVWQGRVWSPGIRLGGLSLHFPSCPLYRQFPSHSRQDENLCWWSLLPGPPVWGQSLRRLRPRGGTSQGGKGCRSLSLPLESLLPQPGLHSQFWDSWAWVPHTFFPPWSQNVRLLIS